MFLFQDARAFCHFVLENRFLRHIPALILLVNFDELEKKIDAGLDLRKMVHTYSGVGIEYASLFFVNYFAKTASANRQKGVDVLCLRKSADLSRVVIDFCSKIGVT